MTLAYFADHVSGALFLLAATALLAVRKPGRGTRNAWIALIGLGAVYDLALNLQPANFPQTNFDHYYLGAKYPAPYGETYRLVHAGVGRAQIGMRDLGQPSRMIRATPFAQRAYYIDCMRAAGVSFDPLVPLDTLAARAHASGAIEAEARNILAAHLPAERIDDFRRDVRAILATPAGPQLTIDYGYNGSPFYGLLRQADPFLHVPFGAAGAVAGLAWTLLGVALVAWLAGMAFGLSTVERLSVAGLILVWPEFSKYAFPGLVFTELWVPILVVAWALRRDRPVLAGVAIAVGGLLKLFPFVLTLVAIVPLVRSFTTGASESDVRAVRRRSFLLLGACAISTVGLGALSLLSGRTWNDFVHKIVSEFETNANIVSSVSIESALLALGVPQRSPLSLAFALASLGVLVAMLWRRPRKGDGLAVPRRALVLIAATGWIVGTWLNYYAMVPLVLLPLIARRHRAVAIAFTAAMAVGSLLPDFDEPIHPTLHLLRLAPFLAAPAWLVAVELREASWGRVVKRAAIAAATLLFLATVGEAVRGRTIRSLHIRGEEALANSDGRTALAIYDDLVRLDWFDARAQRKRAIALATLGRRDDALAGFARAVTLAPGDAAAHDDFGRALLLFGRLPEAAAQIEAAASLEPHEVQILYQLARVRQEQARRDEMIALLRRALELAPDEPVIIEALAQAEAP